jgi:hypothetical protein
MDQPCALGRSGSAVFSVGPVLLLMGVGVLAGAVAGSACRAAPAAVARCGAEGASFAQRCPMPRRMRGRDCRVYQVRLVFGSSLSHVTTVLGP